MNIPVHQGGNLNIPPMNQPMPQNYPSQHGPYQNVQTSVDKMENIMKIKSLVGPLRDSLSITLKSAAQTLHQNNLIDTSKATDIPEHRFNKNMEEFQSICDQIELHLKNAIGCISQNSSSMRYLPLPVAPVRPDNMQNQDSLSYPQFLSTVQSQVQYAREIHNTLINAANTMTTNE